MSTSTHPISKPVVRIMPRLRGWRALLTHNGLRRLIQWSFALFILYIAVVGERSGAITASPEAYCPFGGLETLHVSCQWR